SCAVSPAYASPSVASTSVGKARRTRGDGRRSMRDRSNHLEPCNPLQEAVTRTQAIVPQMSARRNRQAETSPFLSAPTPSQLFKAAAPADLNDPPTESSVIAEDLLTDRASQAIVGADCEAGHCFFLCCGHKSKTHQRRSSTLKVYLASWHLSADTAANARKSKVIGGRFYDGFHTCETEIFINLIPAGKWSASHVNEPVDQRH